MAFLLTANALVFISLYAIWRKSDLLNISIKIILLILALSNGFQSYQAFETLRVEAAAKASK